jgi:hypothetical protein
MKENLNIEENKIILVRAALKRTQSPLGASLLLKVSDRTVHRYINQYNIKWKNPESQQNSATL